jgi:lysophospholipase L1-like esterase
MTSSSHTTLLEHAAVKRDAARDREPSDRALVRTRRERFPRAFAWALGICLSLTGATWLTAFALLQHKSRTLLVLGDSVFAGYRQEPGVRFQDWLQRYVGSEWSVVNFAEPSAQTGDFYLRLMEAELLGVKPDLVVIGLAPQKLIPDSVGALRLNEDGANLSWLPLDREGYRYYQTLDDHLKRIAVTRKLGLVAGFYDGLRRLSLEYLEWPSQRRRRARASESERSEWIRTHTQELEERWVHAQDTQLSTSNRTQDFTFLIEALRARHIRVVVVMPPALHPRALRMLSGSALHNLNDVYQQTLEFCAQLGVPVLDFNAPDTRRSFVSAEWDDLNHLRAPACFQRMARAVYDFIQAQYPASRA